MVLVGSGRVDCCSDRLVLVPLEPSIQLKELHSLVAGMAAEQKVVSGFDDPCKSHEEA